jgi:hypothetical protein
VKRVKITDGPLPDVCVVLNRLCVVDVDSDEANECLLARFPDALASAPVEKTSRGFHYWFVRPDVADELGYYDGAAQRGKAVDFKSVFSNGTGGIIVVAPGDGRSWVRGRSLWDSKPFDIPSDLLDAVAAPKTPRASCVMRCLDGELVEARRSLTVTVSSYFEPVVSGDFDGDCFPVPLPSLLARDLVAIVDSRRLPPDVGTPAIPDVDGWVAEVARAADIVGLPRASLDAALNSEVVSADIWARKVVPVHALARRSETEAVRLVGDSALSQVPDVLALEPLSPAVILEWGLFAEFATPPIVPGGLQLSISAPPSQAFARAVPAEVAALLERHPDTLVAAGGFVAGAVLDRAAPGSDVDLFVHSCAPDQADALLAEFMLTPGSTFVCATPNAVTLAMDGERGPLAVQLVRRIHSCRAHVVSSFDFPPCKVLARSAGPGRFALECLPSFMESARSMAFVVDFSCWNAASSFRALKYCAKGFAVVLPGVSSEMRRAPPPPLTTCDAAVLLNAHAHIVKSRAATPSYRQARSPREDARVTIAEVCGACKHFQAVQQSGYEEIALSGRLEHALREIGAREGGPRGPESAHERLALVLRADEWMTGDLSRPKPAKHGRLLSRIGA